MFRSPNIVRVIKSRRLKWAHNIDRMEYSRNSFKIFITKFIDKRLPGREDNIKIKLPYV